MLRAVQKGNQPSLISSLASDTALLYRSAAQTAQGVPYAQSGHKAVAYAQYKATSFQAYAHAFAGELLHMLSTRSACTRTTARDGSQLVCCSYMGIESCTVIRP